MISRSLFALILLAASFAALADSTIAPQWRVMESKSRLGFVAYWERMPFEGTFERWSSELRFDPRNLAGSGFDVTIKMAHADTASRERDEALPQEEWFDVGGYPQARFVTRSIRQVGRFNYQAEAQLTLKGITRTLRFPFRWKAYGDRAKMDARITLDRTDYNVGSGDWASGDVIRKEVEVVVDLVVERIDTP